MLTVHVPHPEGDNFKRLKLSPWGWGTWAVNIIETFDWSMLLTMQFGWTAGMNYELAITNNLNLNNSKGSHRCGRLAKQRNVYATSLACTSVWLVSSTTVTIIASHHLVYLRLCRERINYYCCYFCRILTLVFWIRDWVLGFLQSFRELLVHANVAISFICDYAENSRERMTN